MKRWIAIAFFLVVPSALGQLPARLDSAGDPLPPGAVLRIGTIRWRTASYILQRSALSPDGKFLFVDEADGGIRILDTDTGLSRRGFGDNALHVWALAISSDGKHLVSAGHHHDGDKFKAIIWDIASGKQLRSLEIGSEWVGVAAFSRDGKKLIVGGPRKDRKLRIFDITSGAEEYSMYMGADSLVHCSPDGKRLIAGSGSEIRVMNMTNGALIRAIDGKGDADTLVGVSQNGGTIAMIGPYGPDKRRTLRLIDAASGKELKIVKDFPGQWLPPAFSPDGKSLAVFDNGELRVWDIAGEKEKWQFPAGRTEAIYFTPDSRRLLSVGSVVRVWDVERGKELHPTTEPYVSATELAYAPDGKTLATSARWDRATIELFDTATGRIKAELEARPLYAEAIDFTSDGRLISSSRHGAQVWDFSTRKMLTELERREWRRLFNSRVRIAPDGQTLRAAVVEWDLRAEPGPPVYVVKWNLANGKLIAAPKRIGSSFRIPELTLDGLSVLVRDENGLSLLDAVTGKQKFKFQFDLDMFPGFCGTTPGDIPCAFSPDGRLVAVSGMNPAAPDIAQVDPVPMALVAHYVLFDLSNGKETQRISQENGFRGLCAFSPDSKRFATADGSRLRIWAAATGKRLWESPVLDHQVTALAFSPDGNRLATALKDSTILIWDVSSTK